MKWKKARAFAAAIIFMGVFFYTDATRKFEDIVDLNAINENAIIRMDHNSVGVPSGNPLRYGGYEEVTLLTDTMAQYKYRPRVFKTFFGKSMMDQPHYTMELLDSSDGNSEIVTIIIRGNRRVYISKTNPTGMSERKEYNLRIDRFDLEFFDGLYNSLKPE